MAYFPVTLQVKLDLSALWPCSIAFTVNYTRCSKINKPLTSFWCSSDISLAIWKIF